MADRILVRFSPGGTEDAVRATDDSGASVGLDPSRGRIRRRSPIDPPGRNEASGWSLVASQGNIGTVRSGPGMSAGPTSGAGGTRRPPSGSPTSPAVPNRIATEMLHLLVVDDDDELRESLATYLRTALHETVVETASDGKSALERFGRGRIDVLLVDYQMPGMDGIELLERIRHIAPDCIRLMLTGRGDFEIAQKAVNEGHVFGFLTKGVDPDEILRQVTAAINSARTVLAHRQAAESTAQQNRRLRAGALGR